MGFTFDAERITAALRERGFDVEAEAGVVSGRLDEGAVRRVWIDQGGTLRLQLTRRLDEGQTERVSRGGRAYKVSRERQAIVNVWTELTTLDGLGDILDEAEDVARGPSASTQAQAAPSPAPVPLPASAPLPGEPGAGDTLPVGRPVTPPPTALAEMPGQARPGLDAHPEASTDLAPPTADETRPDDTPAPAPPSLAEAVAARVSQLVPRRRRRKR